MIILLQTSVFPLLRFRFGLDGSPVVVSSPLFSPRAARTSLGFTLFRVLLVVFIIRNGNGYPLITLFYKMIMFKCATTIPPNILEGEGNVVGYGDLAFLR